MSKVFTYIIPVLLFLGCSTSSRKAGESNYSDLKKDTERATQTDRHSSYLESAKSDIISQVNRALDLWKSGTINANNGKYVFNRIKGIMEESERIGNSNGYNNGLEKGKLKKTIEINRDVLVLGLLNGKEATIDCSEISLPNVDKLLLEITGSQRFNLNYLDFSNAVETLHLTIIHHLNSRLEGDFYSNVPEKRYRQIHARLTFLLYKKYLRLLSTRNNQYNPSFYNFRRYYAVECFNTVFGSTLNAVLDGVYSLAYEDWLEMAEVGLKSLGSTTDCINTVVFPSIGNQLLDAALKFDIESLRPKLTYDLMEMYADRPLEGRADTTEINDQIRFALVDGHAEIAIEARTNINVGIQQWRIQVAVDHINKTISVSIPNEPDLKDLLFQDYVIKDVNIFLNCNCDPDKKFPKIGYSYVSEGQLKNMYLKHRPKLQDMAIVTNPLGEETLNQLIPELQMRLMSYNSLFASCYAINLEFGGNLIPLLQSNCSSSYNNNINSYR